MDLSKLNVVSVRCQLNFDSVIEQAFSQLIHEPWGKQTSISTPLVDIFESDDAYVLAIELPGVSPDAIDLRVEDNRLVISGNRAALSLEEFGSAVNVERTWGRFSRAIQFERPVDFQRMEHRLDHGVMYVRIPKKAA